MSRLNRKSQDEYNKRKTLAAVQMKAICRARLHGVSLKRIGEIYGINRYTVHDIISGHDPKKCHGRERATP